ncbi:MAG: recombinase zinc beta ribbon domain-containing protein [Candidatus Limnocylindria bacterium]
MCMAAQYQRDLDAERGKRRAAYVYQMGGHNGLDPLGYRAIRESYPKGEIIRPRNLEIVEGEAQVVRRIVRALASRSFVQIAHTLSAERVLGRLWTVDAVKDVWRRRRFYVGFAVWKRGLDERDGKDPPTLDDENYRAAETGVAVRRRAGRANRPHRTYLLSGLAKCACNANLRGTATLNRGIEWRYYRCGVRCAQPSASADHIERAVVQAVREAALPARVIQAAREELSRRLKVPTAGLSDKKRQRLTTALQRSRDLYTWGDLTEAEYRTQKASLEQSIAEVPDSDKLVQFDAHRRVVLTLAQSVDSASPSRVKELVGLLVEQVPVCDGQVDPEEIVWTPAARRFLTTT